MKLTYADGSHAYHLDGQRAKSVTAVAKIPADTYAIEQWAQRQVAIGLAMDHNLVENVATDVDNRDALNGICEQAKRVASSHRAADRGTQMHRVFELALLGQEHRLLTDQQRRDTEVLRRTLDKYGLTPHDGLVEQFVVWPHYLVAGRFDAVLEKPSGTPVLVDLKSSENAIRYPHSVAVQLALYARAPHISAAIDTVGDRSTVTAWREMPARLERRYAYVLLVEPDAEVGTLHEVDVERGWAAARLALEIVNWRKAKDYGRGIVSEVVPPAPLIERAATAPTLNLLRELWERAVGAGELTAEFRSVAIARAEELKAGAA